MFEDNYISIAVVITKRFFSKNNVTYLLYQIIAIRIMPKLIAFIYIICKLILMSIFMFVERNIYKIPYNM